MSILDTFVSVFTADTDSLKKGYDQANKGADDVVENMKDAELQARKTGDELISMAKKAAGFIAAAVLANKGVQEMVAQAAEISRMDDASDSINTAIEDVDAFSKSIMSLGGDKQAAEDSLVSIFEAVNEAAKDSQSEAGKAFRAMGVSAKDAAGNIRPVMDVLDDVAKAVEGIDAKKAKEYMAAIGITDRATVDAILKGRATLQSMMSAQKEMGVVTKESAERAKAFDAAIGGLTAGLDRSKQMIVSAVLPAFTLVIEWLKSVVDWMTQNKDLVVGFFIAVATIIAAMYLPAMISAAAATLVALAPVLLIAAALAALAAAFALAYDDIMNFIRGNDSFIGQVIEQYPALGKVITMLLDAWKTLFGYLGDALDFIRDATGVSFGSMGDFIKTFIHFLLGSLNSVVEWSSQFTGHFKSAADAVAAIFAWLVEKVQAAIGFMTSGIDSIKSGVQAVGGWFGIGGDDEPEQDEPKVSRKQESRSRSWFNWWGSEEDPAQEPTPQRSEPNQGGSTTVIRDSLPSDPAQEPTPQTGAPRPDVEASKLNNDAVAFTDQLKQTRDGINGATNQMESASAEPMNSVTSNAISNSSNVSNETYVEVGEVRIETQATDAQGVATDIGGELQNQLKNLQAETSTGIAR